ncbi:MAG TPA: L,D-transpeptidase family protein [Burkholderiaceae bacterium]|nr:L,D-transpeptidase family protein [Rhodoferax sp.]MBP6156771.1 L,D-transpeptidase family protein [Polaromonas sp.]MBP8873475.1 L,D-transpeptidase family protein [Polaromonas sp.]HOZ66365.1 L,D-transpeptidase family protein [Burkholderiaceae bacterium]
MQKLGDVPHTATPELNDLREESLQRIKALKERPPADSIPSQFLTLSKRNKHAIAVDTSRSRLYLFKNDNSQMRLIADFYISVGKLGVEKSLEGDQRTPLGVYFITSSLNPKSLKDLYGTGALPINYPNPLDTRRGKTGSGIWLHGTPSNQFSRAPKASDGCVVLANPDLNYLLKEVSIRTTPVVISEKLEWVQKTGQKPEELQFFETLQNWRLAKSSANFDKLMGFYSKDFSSYDKNLVQWASVLGEEVAKNKGNPISLSELSMIRWVDKADTMVVTFDELANNAKSGKTKRQYWTREGKSWKIFFEGVI